MTAQDRELTTLTGQARAPSSWRSTRAAYHYLRRSRLGLLSGLMSGAIIVVGLPSLASAGSSKADPKFTVPISATSCAKGWSGTGSGRHQFEVRNSSTELFSVELVGADQTSVYGEIETLAPNTTVPLDLVLDPGTYHWKCTTSLGSVSLSSAGTVRGKKVSGAKANLPVSYAELVTATTSYRSQIQSDLDVLAADTDALTSAVASGNLPRAEQLWLVAHLDYARLGAAYGTFGDFDAEINGRPNGLPGGVNDPKFYGFLRLEYGLWNGQSDAEMVPVADRLDTDVHELVTAFPTQATDPTDVPLRTHEILENTLQFELTGETDQGSHTNLATAAANVAGTETTLDAIAPLLEERNPALVSTLESGLTQVGADLQNYQLPDGSWVPLQALSQAQREQIDGALASLLEELAQVPDILEISPNAADKT
jgi:high-affinity iron transporter